MHLFKKIAISIILSFISITALSQDHPQCPSAASIKAHGLITMVEGDGWRGFWVEAMDFYNTKHLWRLVIKNVHANSTESAVAQGKTLIQKLSGTPTPGLYGNGYSQTGMIWACHYNIDNDHTATATRDAYDV